MFQLCICLEFGISQTLTVLLFLFLGYLVDNVSSPVCPRLVSMSCQQCICVWLPIVSPVVSPCLSGLSVFCLCSCLVSLSCRVHSPLVWSLRLPFPVIITLCFILYLPSQSCLNVCLSPVPRSCSQVLVLVSVCVCVTFLYFCV